jgi:Malic enzyme, NAD binding domain
MVAQGCSEAGARRRNWLMDSRGLVVKARSDLAEHKLPYAHDHAPIGDFLTAIRTLKPSAIIGVAATGGMFTREVLETMAELNGRPIVFALSNPTSKSECTAEEAYRHTDGRALFACGSPFEPVKLNGRTFVPRQGNNSYIFQGSDSAPSRAALAASRTRCLWVLRARSPTSSAKPTSSKVACTRRSIEFARFRLILRRRSRRSLTQAVSRTDRRRTTCWCT